MVRRQWFSFLVILLFCCQEDDEKLDIPIDPEVILPKELGTKILSSSDTYYQGKLVWGADNDVFFIDNSIGISRYDYDLRKKKSIGAWLVGDFELSADKTEILIRGRFKEIDGIYSYKISDNETTLLEPLGNKRIIAAKYNNGVFMTKWTIIRYTDGCMWSECYKEVEHEFSHKDVATNIVTPLRGRMSSNLFSVDGSRLLIRNDLNYWYYNLDTKTLVPTDSFEMQPIDYRLGPGFFSEGKLKSPEILFGDVTIWDRLADLKMDSIKTSAKHINEIKWSYQGDRLYYTGGCKNDGCSVAIWYYDLRTKEEKIILSLPSSFIDPRSTETFTSSPFQYLAISPDDRRLAYSYMGEIFVKEF